MLVIESIRVEMHTHKVPPNDNPTLSFAVVVRNGADVISELLDDVLRQDFPLEKIEILFADSCSTDGTKKILTKFAAENKHLNVRILDNEGIILSSGMNIILSEARGDIILRVDAHSRIPTDFMRKNVKRIQAGERVCGGYCSSLATGGKLARVIYMGEVSKFGASPAGFRNKGISRYVDTLAYAAYSREIFDLVGYYDERLVRNQDNEMHSRMRKSGIKFFYDSEICSWHKVRPTLLKLLKQKFGNGFWVGRGFCMVSGCFALRHWIPFLFIVALLGSFLIGIANLFHSWSWYPMILLTILYIGAAMYFTIQTMICEAKGWEIILCLLLPPIFFSIHMAYGFGTLMGLFIFPFSLLKDKNQPYSGHAGSK